MVDSSMEKWNQTKTPTSYFIVLIMANKLCGKNPCGIDVCGKDAMAKILDILSFTS